MSLDEFNKHATLGRMAGPATTAAASAGQAMHDQLNAPHATSGGGTTAPPVAESKVAAVLAVMFAGSVAALLAHPPSFMVVIVPLLVSGVWLGTYIVQQGLAAVLGGVKVLVGNSSTRGWLWVVGAGVFGWCFAMLHFAALYPLTPLRSAIFGLVLATVAKLVPVSRPVCAALAAVPVAYVLSFVYLPMSSMASMVFTLIAAGLAFVVCAVLARQQRKAL